MVAIALTMNQKIYSAEQQEVRQPDAEITAPADSTNHTHSATNAVTYSLIPDYGKNINSMAVAELNRHLQVHGYYEFAPATYADITRQTQKHGMPIDVSFSRETQRATITWNRQGLFCCFHGREKIKIFETIPIAAATELSIAQPTITHSKRPSATPLVQPISAHQQAARIPTERSIFEPSAVPVVTPKPSTTTLASTQQQVASTQRSIPQPPPAYVAPKPQTHFPPASQIVYPRQQTSSLFLPSNALQQQGRCITEQEAYLALYSEFSKLTEIRTNHYLAPDQSNQIISDLMRFGKAIKFEPRTNDYGALFFVIAWNDRFEKFYKISKRT
jgi:hypothetical protein